MAIIGPPSTEQPLDPKISKLFRDVKQDAIIKKGSLVAFNYGFWIHDPYPLVIVTDVFPGKLVRGVNLHYLTFPFIKTILQGSCENVGFSYSNIRGDKYITNAFRSYKWPGIRQIKKLDCDFLLTVMATVRSFDPSQIQTIRESVQQQMSRTVNPPAQPTGEMNTGQIPGT